MVHRHVVTEIKIRLSAFAGESQASEKSLNAPAFGGNTQFDKGEIGLIYLFRSGSVPYR